MSIVTALKSLYKKYELVEDQIQRAINYFQFYKYLSQEFSLEDFENAVVRLQRQANLLVDGQCGPKTLRSMYWPRCGCPEYMEEANQLRKWALDIVNVYIESRDSDLSARTWDEVVIKALEGAEKVCGIRFRIVHSLDRANIVLGVGRGKKDNFDGPSGVLGWCELPSPNYRGRINSKLDADETWVYPDGRGIKLLNVISHEVCGHGLGLGHTEVSGSLMNPFYNPAIAYPTSAWDIPELQKRYGPPKNSPATPPGGGEDRPCSEILIRVNSGGECGKIAIDGYRVQPLS